MRIMVINTWYYPNMQGGAEHSVKLLSENLQKNNAAAVFCVDNKEKGIKKESINGVTIYRSDGRKYNLYRSYFEHRGILKKVYDKYHEIINKSVWPDLIYALDDFRPDIVHCNCISGISLELFSVLKKKNIPVVLTLRNYFLLYPLDEDVIPIKYLNNIMRKLYTAMSKRYTCSVHAVTAPSDFTLREHLKHGFFHNSKIKQCVPNSIEFDLDYIKRTVKDKYHRADINIRFLYVGWLTESKGIKDLIQAFKRMDYDNIELIICGNGKLEPYVIEAEKNDGRIHYLGKLDSKNLSIQYNKADILVVPSIWEEPFGRVIIEGNQHGLPVICSNRGGMPEIIRKMKSGLIYEAENVNELVSALEYMMKKENRKEFYSNILDNIGYYSIENQINMFSEIYNKVLNFHAPGMRTHYHP